EQSFFVKINDKTFGSSPSGYLILSKLKDSTYNLNIGFPQNKWQAQQFLINVKTKDKGYFLKNFGEKGWGLVDMETLNIQMPEESQANDKRLNLTPGEVSPFTLILSKAANDPSLLSKPDFASANKNEKKVNPQYAVVKESSSITNTAPKNTDAPEVLTSQKNDTGSEKKDTPKETISLNVAKREVSNTVNPEVRSPGNLPYEKSSIQKKSESSTTDGLGIMYVDQYKNGQKDTIRIFISNPFALNNKTSAQSYEEKKFIDFNEPLSGVKSTGEEKIEKNNCSIIVSDADFQKLRKVMVTQKTETSRILRAKEDFGNKCYTIEQIKSMGNLFLSEATKFHFFEAIYPFSDDKSNFAALLKDEFKDTYFVHRLKNLAR
ncbi:MAG: DUF4476 domain-containing protein, partial [Chitinophagaceae bacterium]